MPPSDWLTFAWKKAKLSFINCLLQRNITKCLNYLTRLLRQLNIMSRTDSSSYNLITCSRNLMEVKAYYH